MEQRALGKSKINISALGLGCMGMSDFYTTNSAKADGIATIHRALEIGINFFDTADMYGPFKNEELLGEALKGRRDQAIIATKFGIVRDPNDSSKRGVNGKAEYVKSSCEASLKRLGVDVIDLYYQHRVDPATPIEETVEAMASLVKEGKVRTLGLSEASSETLRRASKIHPISALQSEYSLWTRDPEDEILNTCRELGITFVAYSPLGRGFLTGQIKRFEDLATDDYRRHSPRFQGENFDKNLQLVHLIEKMAQSKSCKPAQLALAWVLAQGKDVVAIPGTKQVKYLEENTESTKINLSADDLAQISKIAPRGVAAGPRYPAAMMSTING